MAVTVGFALPTTSLAILTAPLAPPAELAEMDPIQLAVEVARSQLYHICLLATASVPLLSRRHPRARLTC